MEIFNKQQPGMILLSEESGRTKIDNSYIEYKKNLKKHLLVDFLSSNRKVIFFDEIIV